MLIKQNNNQWGNMGSEDRQWLKSKKGVIAITPALIQRALTVTGPIDVPEYHETVTAQNLVDHIHYY